MAAFRTVMAVHRSASRSGHSGPIHGGTDMLKGLDPLLSPDLLQILRAMGHGDEIVIVDANFPSASIGPRVVRLDGVSAVAAASAVLSVMPLDDFVDIA